MKKYPLTHRADKTADQIEFLGWMIFIVFIVLVIASFVGCTIAPTGNHVGQATISDSGKADSGLENPAVENVVAGQLVEPSYRANYIALLKNYGDRISPPNPDPDTGWDLTPRADGLLWCNSKVVFDYGTMNFLHEQDLKLQTAQPAN